MPYDWHGIGNHGVRQYTCGYCGNLVASEKGFQSTAPSVFIRMCPSCGKPTLFENAKVSPDAPPGEAVANVPKDVEALYEESRRCVGGSNYTAAVLATRKLLMHLAVEKGADEGSTFVEYVEFLASKGYVPPDGRGWVDHIRSKGNEANHEIKLMTREDADDLISFSEMLLKFIYEFPNRVPKKPTT